MRILRFAVILALAAAGVQPAAARQPGDAVTTTVPSSLDGRPITVYTSHEALESTRTTAEERARFHRQLLTKNIREGFAKPPAPDTLEAWKGGLWATKLLYRKTADTRRAVRRALRVHGRVDTEFDRLVLETICAAFPGEFTREVRRIADVTTSPKQFAMAAHHIVRAEPRAATRRAMMDTMKRRFPGLRSKDEPTSGPHPILLMLRNDLDIPRDRWVRRRPDLAHLLDRAFLPGHTVVYSFQRTDRRQPGLAVVRRGDGRFVRQPDGTLFHVPHLAMALSNLPGYLTNSNTPQGIMSVVGIDVTPRNRFIGTTPFLHTAVPHEAVPEVFLHDAARAGTSWTLSMYTGLLPNVGATRQTDRWRDYVPMREAYFAGEAGRSEMLAHGTTVDPDPYAGQPYHPNTPSLGCMTAQELWSGVDGRAMMSDQLALVNAFLSGGTDKGFLVVVELDARRQPVNLLEVRLDVLKADDNARTGAGDSIGE